MSTHLSDNIYNHLVKALQRLDISLLDLSEADLKAIRVRVANNYQVFPGQMPPSAPATQVIKVMQHYRINLLSYREFLKKLEEEPAKPQYHISEHPFEDIGDIMERTQCFVGEMRLQVINAIIGYLTRDNMNAMKFQYVLEHYGYIDLVEKLLEAGITDEHFYQYIKVYHMVAIPE